MATAPYLVDSAIPALVAKRIEHLTKDQKVGDSSRSVSALAFLEMEFNKPEALVWLSEFSQLRSLGFWNPKGTKRGFLLLMPIMLVQVFDIIIHIALNQIEPIRLVAVGVLFIALVTTRSFEPVKGIWVLGTAGAIYLILNGIFILQNGLTNGVSGEPRVMLLLIISSTALLGVLYGRSFNRKANQN